MRSPRLRKWQGMGWATQLERSVSRNPLFPFAILLFQSLSAGCLVLASSSVSFGWLAWFCLLPLFLVTVLFRPTIAGLYGLFWGLSYFVALSLFVKPVSSPTSIWLGTLTTISPALYTFLVCWMVRRSGFNPLIVGFAWIGLELLLRPLSLPLGVLGTTHATGEFGEIIGPLLGYVLVSFVIAFVNALLLRFLLGLRFSRPQRAHFKSAGIRRLADLLSQVYRPASASIQRSSRAPPKSA